MGRKLECRCVSSLAAALGMRRMTPFFHRDGTVWSLQHILKRSNNAGPKEGHHLNTRYVTWSSGLGEDFAVVFLRIASRSCSVKGLSSKG